MKRRRICFLLFILVVGVLATGGCGPQPPTSTPLPPIATPTGIATSEEIALLTATVSPSISLEPSATPTPTPCPPPKDWVPYVVEPGDNLYRLALPYGLMAEDLQAANCLSSADEIQVGQRIYIPWYITPTPTLPPTPTPCYVRGDWVLYTVQPGDNLYRIAVRYGLSVWDMQAGNCLESDWIVEGQTLYVPYLIPTSQPPVQPNVTQSLAAGRPPAPRITRTPSPCDTPVWLKIDSDVVSASYTEGLFQIEVNKPKIWAVARGGCDIQDIAVVVTARPIKSFPDSGFGLVCRYTDNGITESYYAFLINDQGQYAVVKVQNGIKDQNPIKWISAEGINTGQNSINQLEIICKDDKLSFSVNFIPLTEITDSTLPQGDIGLIATTSSGNPIVIAFEGEKAIKPPQ